MNRADICILFVAAAFHVCEASKNCQIVKLCGDPNEEWTNCGSQCEPSCDQPGPVACIMSCKLDTCQCKHKYLRRRDGLCVEPQDCDR